MQQQQQTVASGHSWKSLRRMRVFKSISKRLIVYLVFLLSFILWLSLMSQGSDGSPFIFAQSLGMLNQYSRTSKESSHVNYSDLAASVDNSTQESLQEVVARIYNLPSIYGREKVPRPNNKCTKYPSLMDLSFNNIYWQVLHTSNGSLYLYSAFFDNRTLTRPSASIRILGMMNRVTPAVTTHCQLWYEGKAAPVVTKVVEYRYIWVRAYGNFRNGVLQPYLIQCVIPPSHMDRVPQSVSLVEGPCDKPTNNLRVTNNLPSPQEQKRNFAVCVKGIDIDEDMTLRIVEWLELLNVLGADKVFIYDLGMHPNISKTFKYYESKGKVDMRSLTLPGEQPSARGLVRRYLRAKITHKRQNEVIPYNDCLYRNMNLYKFVVLLDIDEVIMPRSVPRWEELMNLLAPKVMSDKGHPYSSYCARNVYFLDSMQDEHGWADDVPRFMHMLQHIYRASNYTKPGSYIKAFHDTQRVRTLHNHFPFSCLEGGCQSYSIPTETAHLQHYRRQCVGELRRTCPYFRNHTVLEDSILRFKEPLVQGVLETLDHLGFIHPR